MIEIGLAKTNCTRLPKTSNDKSIAISEILEIRARCSRRHASHVDIVLGHIGNSPKGPAIGVAKTTGLSECRFSCLVNEDSRVAGGFKPPEGFFDHGLNRQAFGVGLPEPGEREGKFADHV